MDDDHLKPLTVMTPDEFLLALHEPGNRIPESDLEAGGGVRISRVRVDEPFRLECESLRFVPTVHLPIVLDHCVFKDLELYGSDAASEGSGPRVDFIECGLPRIRISNGFSWLRVIESNVGEVRLEGAIEHLILNGRAEKTALGGSIHDLYLDNWITTKLFVNVDEDCTCHVMNGLKNAPLTVEAFAATHMPVWAKLLHLLCPGTPIIFCGSVAELGRA